MMKEIKIQNAYLQPDLLLVQLFWCVGSHTVNGSTFFRNKTLIQVFFEDVNLLEIFCYQRDRFPMCRNMET